MLLAVASWWGATGLIFFLVRRPSRTFAVTLAVASVLGVAGLALLYWASRSATIVHSGLSFLAAMLIWGWLEIAFLLGAITGPRRTACAPDRHGFARFMQAIDAILYHELAIFAVGMLVIAVSWGAPNQTGLWTYLMLWGMRVSAKLNLFLGVPNTGELLLPAHLRYLGSFFRLRRLNPVFPVSVLLSTGLTVLLCVSAWNAPRWSFGGGQNTLLATLATLALLEHWLLVLPLRVDALWPMATDGG